MCVIESGKERVNPYLTSGRRQSVNSFSNKWNIVFVWPTTSRKKIFGSILGSDKGMAITEIHHNRLTEITDSWCSSRSDMLPSIRNWSATSQTIILTELPSYSPPMNAYVINKLQALQLIFARLTGCT